jgi:hypothetical protein
MVSLSIDVIQFHLNSFPYANGSIAQRSIFLRLTPFRSRKNGVYPSAKGQPADKGYDILEIGDIADPPHVSQQRRNTLCWIVKKLVLEGEFVKDRKHQNRECRQRGPANESAHLFKEAERMPIVERVHQLGSGCSEPPRRVEFRFVPDSGRITRSQLTSALCHMQTSRPTDQVPETGPQWTGNEGHLRTAGGQP